MSKNEIEIKAGLSLEQAAGYLLELAQCLSAGKVVVQRGSGYLVLRPQRLLEVEIKAQRKKGKENISLELSWRMEEAHNPACDFKISSEAPSLPVDEPNPLDREAPAQPEPPREDPDEEAGGPSATERAKAGRPHRK